MRKCKDCEFKGKDCPLKQLRKDEKGSKSPFEKTLTGCDFEKTEKTLKRVKEMKRKEKK